MAGGTRLGSEIRGRALTLLNRSAPRRAAWAVASLAALLLVFRITLPRAVPAGIIAFGVVVGSTYGLTAVGLILIYRSNRIINFAVAEMGLFGAILFEDLDRGAHWPWLAAAVTGVLASAVLAYVLDRFIARRFFTAPRLILTVVTIGMAQVVAYAEFAVNRAFGRFPASAGLRTPLSSIKFRITGVIFDGNALILVAAVVGAVVGLEVLARRTDFGVATRATAENAERASLLGVPVKKVATVAWVVAGGLAGAGTVLRTPVVGLAAGSTLEGPGLLLRGLAAAVIARFEDTRVAVAAALLIGVVDQAIYYAYSDPDVSNALLVLLIVVALLFQRSRAGRSDEQATSSWQAVEDVRPIPVELRHLPVVRYGRAALTALLAAAVMAVPLVLGPAQLFRASDVVLYGIVAVSLVVLTGWSGQISLGQFGVAAIGAGVASRLAADLHWDFFVATAAAGLAGAVASMLLGGAALRIRGFFFAVTSLGFAVAVETFFLNRRFFPYLLPNARPDRPILLHRFQTEGEAAFYLFSVATLGVVIFGVRTLRRTRTGRVLIATRDNDFASRAYGVRRIRTLLLSFAVSGFIAGLAGALLAAHDHALSPSAYSPAESIAVFAMVVIGGLGSVPGAVLGAVFVRGGTLLFPPSLAPLTSGAGLLAVLLVFPGGLGRLVFQARDAILRGIADRRGLLVPSLVADRAATQLSSSAAPGLLTTAGPGVDDSAPDAPASDTPTPEPAGV